MNIEQVVAPMSVSDFRAVIEESREPALIRGEAGKFADLFSVDDYWECIRQGKPDGSPLPRASVTSFQLPVAFDAGAIGRALRSGNTVCVSHMDRASAKLRALCLDVESELGFPGTACVHCYYSPPRTGYDFFHMDAGVAITLQIAGTKKWEYAREPAVEWSTRVGGFRENGKLEWFGEPDWSPSGPLRPPESGEFETRVLLPGDLLVMPPGVWHRVQSSDVASISLNLKLTHTTSVDALMQFARHRCLDEGFWRRPLPFASRDELERGMPQEETKAHLKEYLLKLSDVLKHMAEDEGAFAQAWFRNFLGSQGVISGSDDSEVLDEEVLQIPDGINPRLATETPGSVTLLGQGKSLRIQAPEIAPLMRDIIVRRHLKVSEVHGWGSAQHFPPADVRTILGRLVRSGFLVRGGAEPQR
ncbi:hypothetical protein LJR260_001616 [Variovorax paradoxus]|uniref:hypothetical protein n=1 Tax=Variovorax paradoxus TaxID=34073 RepID=UPI003ECC258C